MSSRTRYAVWIVILVSLLLPFRPLFGAGFISLTPPHVAGESSNSTAVTEKVSQTTAASSPALPLAEIVLYSLLAIWLLGSIIYLVHHFIQYIKLRRLIQRVGTEVTDPDHLELFHNLMDYMQVRNKNIRLVTCNFIKSPMLTGFRHPVILLPEQRFNSQQMEVILEHELTHYLHRDLFVNLLMILATSLHWFNPVVRFSNQVIQEEGEILCDEAVLRGKNLDYRRFYGKTILSLIETGEPKAIALSTYFFESKSNLQHRLIAILDIHNPMRRLSYLTLLCSACLIVLSSSVFVLATELQPKQARTARLEQTRDSKKKTKPSSQQKASETSSSTSTAASSSSSQQPASSSSSSEAASSTTAPSASQTAPAQPQPAPPAASPSAPAANNAAPNYAPAYSPPNAGHADVDDDDTDDPDDPDDD